MTDYYAKNLSAERLKRCYEMAPPRIRHCFKAEIGFVTGHIRPNDSVLDLGCGYGRTLRPMADIAERVVGIDSSMANLILARQLLSKVDKIDFACADAGHLPFADRTYDLVTCIQNGISAFHIDPILLINESVRVTRPGGTILFSTYSERIWNERLEWFELQSAEGLLGEIDYDKTGRGEIVCKDGFTATTFSENQFLKLTEGLDAEIFITEVDRSSLFCIIEL